MRKLQRPTLTAVTLRKLTKLTSRVGTAPSPKDQAEASWKSKPRVAFEEIRSVLERMASGRSRCMYCEDSMGTDIDHFWPKAPYPDKAFLWENYLLACSYCNSNMKRQDFPLDPLGVPLLIDPSVDNPVDHLIFLPSTGEYGAVDSKGTESIRIFGLNDHEYPRRLPKGRKEALVSLTALLRDYDKNLTDSPVKAAEIREAIKDFPFNSILCWLVRTASLPTGNIVLGADIVQLVNDHRVNTWL